MSNTNFEMFSETDCIFIKQNCLPAQSSPNSELQYFYENFNPESNEECLFGSACYTQEVSSDVCNSNIDKFHVWFNQVNTACEQTVGYSKCCFENPLYDQTTQVERASEICHHSEKIKKTISKKKRKRITFTTEQIIAMEQIFKTRPYICREDRLALTQKLQICEKSIKVWFQNRRRISEKREKLYIPDSPSSVDTCDSNCDRLAYIESHINERVDLHGNVALDEHVMIELVKIIDEYLPKQAETLSSTYIENNPNMPNTDLEDAYKESCENRPIYEPISPASIIDEFLL